MKRELRYSLLFGLTLFLSATMLILNAQVQPSVSNLKHLWDFEAGNGDDRVGDADGELTDNATIHNGVLDLTDTAAPGGSLTLPADIIQINTYSVLSIETWATPSAVTNSGKALMMWSFGTYGNPGLRYFFFTPARWGGQTAARLSVGQDQPWANEDGFAFDDNIGDSALHHYVVKIDTANIVSLYVDGVFHGADTMDAVHVIDSIANDDAFIGKSVYSPDPTWKGTIELFAIWDVALSAEEILWLYNGGPKAPLVSVHSLTADLSSVTIYANNNQLFIKNVPADVQTVSVTLYNITGSVVYQNNNFQNGTHLNLNNGIYLVKANISGKQFKEKILIR